MRSKTFIYCKNLVKIYGWIIEYISYGFISQSWVELHPKEEEEIPFLGLEHMAQLSDHYI